MRTIDASLASLEARFREIAESPGQTVLGDHKGDFSLRELGLITDSAELTELGESFYVARHVRQDDEESSLVLAAILKQDAIVTAFCSKLWGGGDIPVTGAVSLLNRLGQQDSHSAKRWLELMNRARLIAYNRKSPHLRILFNPEELIAEPEAVERERSAGHVISPESPYGNLMALRELLRASRTYLYWYEQHLDQKVMEVLYREIPQGSVSIIRLLSGPSNATSDLKAEFKRFRKEMTSQRGVTTEWRILTRSEAQKRHDRFFFSKEIAKNLPPLNLILGGSRGEILPSQLGPDDFENWWEQGQDLMNFQPVPKNT